jgi:hypothetical protein
MPHCRRRRRGQPHGGGDDSRRANHSRHTHSVSPRGKPRSVSAVISSNLISSLNAVSLVVRASSIAPISLVAYSVRSAGLPSTLWLVDSRGGPRPERRHPTTRLARPVPDRGRVLTGVARDRGATRRAPGNRRNVEMAGTHARATMGREQHVLMELDRRQRTGPRDRAIAEAVPHPSQVPGGERYPLSWDRLARLGGESKCA